MKSMRRFAISASLFLTLLLFGLAEGALAQSDACNKHCGAFDAPCKVKEASCETKLGLYKTYMAQISANVTLFSLPPQYIDILQPFYPGVALNTVRFGFSPRQLSVAITDCDTIFFTDSSFVDRVRDGTLSKDNNDDFNTLYHELTHAEQCAQQGGRDKFAVMWWEDLDLAIAQNPDPTTLHDHQPMEAAAINNALVVDSALPDGLVLPVSISSLTSDLTSPQSVNTTITWTAQASGGRGAIEFDFKVRRAGTVVAQQAFGNGNTFRFTPAQEGNFTVSARARQANPQRTPNQVEAPFVVAGAGGRIGGDPFVSACRTGSVMAGLNVRTGLYVDSIQAVCVAVNADGSWKPRRLGNRPLSTFFFVSQGARAGGLGGTATTLMCDQGWGIKALYGRSGNGIDSLGIRCGKLGPVAPGVGIVDGIQNRAAVGGNGGAPFDLQCPTSQVATQVVGRAGNLVKNAVLICDNPTP